jgi:predicted short-subunit dehydrogenase-like oxidoreductase (DUF2520 family)
VEQLVVSFIGAGRVAEALCREFYGAGIKILEIVSRTGDTGRKLASGCEAAWKSNLKLSGQNDAVIVAVPDDSLRQVLSHIETGENTIVAHTAGSVGLEVFPVSAGHKGVFYPLQTFSPGRMIDFKGLPFFLEVSDKLTLEVLSRLAGSVGGSVRMINEDQRQLLHTAAVFVNNFTNYMLTAGKILTDRAEVPFSLLEPLIRETIDKAIAIGPLDAQTGPAVRADKGTLEKHINLLSFSPELQNIYREITRAIITQNKNTTDDQF